MRRVLISLLCFLISVLYCEGNVSCKDEQGNDVDWWYMYKLPKNYQASGQDKSGQRYLYVTSTSYDDWQFSGHRIGESNSLIASTLRPLYAEERHVLLALYSDQSPDGKVWNTGGHAKGVVASDGVTGVWIVHSVPKFPAMPDLSYPDSGEHYAQSLMCVTVNAEGVEKIGSVLVFNEPHFYYKRNPLLQTAEEKFPSLVRALNAHWRTQSPYQTEVELETLGGKNLRIFGKSPRANVELYSDVVAPALDANLLVEAWRDGPGNLPSSCNLTDKVYNVDHINSETFAVDFKTTSDHSKWAVTEESGIKLVRWRIGGSDWTCVGDINRQQHQLQRGGGTVCHKSSRIAHLYRQLVSHYDKCN